MVLLAVIEWAGCRFTEQKFVKHHFHIIFTSFSPILGRLFAMLCQGSKSRANFWSSLLRRLLASGAQFFILFQGMTSHDFKNHPSTIQIRDGQSVYVKCEPKVSLGPLCYYGCYGFSLRQNSSRCGKSFEETRLAIAEKEEGTVAGIPMDPKDPGRVT